MKNLLLLTASLFLALGLSEIAFRLFSPQQLVLMNTDKIWRKDALLGWRNRENADTWVNTGDKRVHFLTDENGFRIGDFEGAKENPAFAVLHLGDSYVEALQVDFEETIPRIADKALAEKGIEVRSVNTGVAGWNPNQYLAEARQLMKNKKFDAVVVYLTTDNDLIREKKSAFSAAQVGLEISRARVSLPYLLDDFLVRRSHLYVFVKGRLRALIGAAGLERDQYQLQGIFIRREAEDVAWETTAQVCKMISAEFGKTRTPVIFVLLPAPYQVYPEIFAKYLQRTGIHAEKTDIQQPNRKLAEAFRNKGLDLMDPLESLRQTAARGKTLYGRVIFPRKSGHNEELVAA